MASASRFLSSLRSHLPKDRRHLKNFLVIQLVDGGIIYALYTPYVLVWLRLSDAQYWHWLVGGIPMALLVNVFLTPLWANMLKRWPVN